MKYYLNSLLFCLATFFQAQQVSANNTLINDDIERIIINGQKSPSYLNETSSAVAVLSQEKISQQNINTLEDAALYVPGLHIGEAGVGNNLFIRGIGSGINYGFEQSVGLFIDGVYYGRGRYSRSGLFDISQIEVYKGPQSSTFGKNTIAGAINITSAKPTSVPFNSINLSYETELNEYQITAITSGALSKYMQGRLAVRVGDSQGYIKNTFTNKSEPNNFNQQARASLLWQASEDLTFDFIAEVQKTKTKGRNDMITISTPTTDYLYRTFADENFVAGVNYEKSQQVLSGPSYKKIKRKGLYDDSDSYRIQLSTIYHMENYSLRSISAFNKYEFTHYLDADYSPLDFISQGRTENHNQISQELILTSTDSDKFSYDVGLYYQKNKLISDRVLDFKLSSVPPVENTIINLLGLPTETPSGHLDATSIWEFEQETDILSSFLTLNYQITNDMNASVNVRYTDEDKEMTKKQFVSKIFQDTLDPTLAYIYGPEGLNSTNSFTFDKNTPNFSPINKENQWTGGITLQYNLTDDVFIYTNISNGFKAGGFDEHNALANIDNETFDREEVISYQFGLKSYFDRYETQFNLEIFNNNFKNIQVSTFDGNCCFVVGNAAEATSQGAEFELTIQPIDDLYISSSLTYLDATYDNFSNAACTSEQLINTPSGQLCQQDLSGKTLQFSPKWAANFSSDYQIKLSSALLLNINLIINFKDKYAIANDLDTNLFQSSFYKVNMGFALEDINSSWSLSLLAKNITNETTFSWGNDTPLGTLGFNGSYFQNIDPPRTYTFQAKYNF